MQYEIRVISYYSSFGKVKIREFLMKIAFARNSNVHLIIRVITSYYSEGEEIKCRQVEFYRPCTVR